MTDGNVEIQLWTAGKQSGWKQAIRVDGKFLQTLLDSKVPICAID